MEKSLFGKFLSYCCKEFEVDWPRVIHAIDATEVDRLINEVVNIEKLSFRILNKGHQMLANSTDIIDLTMKECD